MARLGSALVGPVTRAATGHLFTWGPAEQAGPALAASYLGNPRPPAAGSQRAGRRLAGRGPLVGRQAELAVLGTARRAAARGHGSVVLITGEPGLGKTRLIQECRKHSPQETKHGPQETKHATQRTLWLEGRCASYASSTPYGLYQQLLASWAGVTPDQPAAVVRPALERVLAQARSSDLFPLLARMMGLPPGAALGRMSPGELQRATFAAWRSLMSRLVAAGPVVLVLEDLHWADPTSLRLSLDLARLAAGRRLLVLATSRPDVGPDVAALERSLAASLPVHQIPLGPLPSEAEQQLARSLIGHGASRAVLDAVLSRVDGNPLFLEERLTSLLETRALVREQGQWQLSPAAGRDQPEVPQALERLVRSRVDRLSPAARDAVRPASVLGTEFPLSLLAAVCAADAADALDEALDELCAVDLLHEVTRRPEPVYRFRHALIQEATYNGLLRAERRLLHGRAAWALEAASPGREAEVAAVLGRHFAAAGETARALRYYELAGDHATAAFANDEAISSFRAALAIVAGNIVTGNDAAVELRAKLANVLWRTGRRGQAREAFQQALDFAGDADPLRRAHLQIRLGRLEAADLRFEAATEAYDAAEKLLGENPGEQDEVTAGHWLELMVDGRACEYTMRNEPERVLALLAEVRPVLEARGNAARKHSYYLHLALGRVARNGYRVDETDLATMRQSLAEAARGEEEKDVGYATFFLGRLLWLHGDLAAAQEQLERALAMAERIGESILLGQSLLALALTALRRHDPAAVRVLVPRVMAEAEGMATAGYLAGAKACLAWLAWQDRRPDEVIALSAEIAELTTATVDMASYHGPVHLWPALAAHLDAGDLAGAVAAARRFAPGLPGDLAETVRAGAAAWDQGRAGQARERLAAALALARDLRFF